MKQRLTQTPDRPNVVLISVDQWRGDALSIEGHPVVRTPHLDQLAAGGARFTRAYAATPSCIAVRAAMMTGLSLERIDDYIPWLREKAGHDADYFDHGLNCNAYNARPWDKPEALHPTNFIVSQSIDFLRTLRNREERLVIDGQLSPTDRPLESTLESLRDAGTR